MGTTSYVDWERSSCLCNVGLPGWAAATCVGVDGQRHLVLIDQALLGDERYTYDPTCGHAVHEQPGPLPKEMLDDLADRRAMQLAEQVLGARVIPPRPTVHRCGRPTKAGGRCRTPVTRPGDACAWHRTHTEREITERNGD
jgi:hypothetical protein